MPGEPIRLGPFAGGINHLSDPTALQDTELLDVVNAELDLDGSYVARPPFFDLASPGSGVGMTLLGWYITDAHTRLIGINSTSLWSYESGAWTAIGGTGTLKATAMVQYDNTAYIIATSDSATDGGSLNDSLTYSTIAAIPRGGAAVVHKERLFIVPNVEKTGSDASLLKGSAPANFSSFPISVYINKGDGQKLLDIVVYNDNLLLFKQDSTYVLAYDADPADAITRKIKDGIGVASRWCVAAYENQLYVLHRNNVYEVVNYDFSKLNAKVPLFYDATQPAPWVSPTYCAVVGDRLLVKYFNRLYLFGLKTKVWTRWDADIRYPGVPVAVPIRGTVNAVPTYIMASADSSSNDIHSMRDIIDGSNPETIFVLIKTKNYDYGVPHRYKRLMWWGADVSTTKLISGIVQPVVVNFSVTWGDLAAFTWGSIAGNTWDQPLSVPFVVQTVVGSQSAMRKFVKFQKSLRFRQINFQLSLSYDGTNVTGPLRFFTFTTLIGTKQHVSKSLT